MKSSADRFAIPRWAALLALTAIVGGAMIVAAGPLFVPVVAGDAVDLSVLFLWLSSAAGYGLLPAMVVGDQQLFGPRDSLLQLASSIALGLGLLSLASLLLGLSGLLNHASAIGMIAAGIGILLWRYRRVDRAAVFGWFRVRSRGSTLLLLFGMPLALLLISCTISPGFLWKPLDPHPYDVLSYHLQIPREWYEAGRIVALPHNSFSYFPMGMEMHFLLAMHLMGGPWAGMYLCQLISAAFAVLTAIALVGALRSNGAAPLISWLGGLAALCTPWTLMLGSVAYVETGVMLYALLSAAWAMRAIGGGAGAWRSFAGASAFAALACGMKYTAFAMTAAPLFLLFPLVAGRRGMKAWAVGLVVWAILLSPWLIRNVAWAHNPVFPLATKWFGSGPFTPAQVDRYLAAHSPPPAERSLAARLAAGWHRVAIDPQFGYVLLPAVVAALCFGWRRPDLRFLSLTLITVAGVWMLATHDLPRFLAPAIPLAALLIALAGQKFRAGRWAVATIVLSQSILGLTWTWQTLQPRLTMGRAGLFRLDDMNVLATDDTLAANRSGQKVALIGEAQAFYYVVPSQRLIYRGVFDVNIPPGVNTVDGWLGKPVEQLRREGCWVVINTSELNRLSRTYAHIPPPPPPYDVPQDTPTVLPPTAN